MNIHNHLIGQVVLGILLMPVVLCFEYKTKEQLQLMPQTVADHIHLMGKEDRNNSSSSEDEDDEDDEDDKDAKMQSTSTTVLQNNSKVC